MALTAIPFAVAFALGLAAFTWLGRSGRLSPEFSAIVAAILAAPLLVALFDVAAMSVLLVSDAEANKYLSLASFGGLLAFVAVSFAPSALLLAPLLTFYLLRAFRQKPLLSFKLVAAVGIAGLAAQVWWLKALSDWVD
jgi:hypothetical protein